MYLKTEFTTSIAMFFVVSLGTMIMRNYALEPAIILTSNIILGAITYLLATKFFNTDIYNEIYGMLWNKK